MKIVNLISSPKLFFFIFSIINIINRKFLFNFKLIKEPNYIRRPQF